MIFHVDAGNSTSGPSGFCLEVRAESKAAALKLLREVLPEQFHENIGEEHVSTVRLYLNADNLTEDDLEIASEDDNDLDANEDES